MKLFTTIGQTKIADPEFGEFEADADGAFQFPDAFAERIHHVHFDGKQIWEDNTERHARIVAEEIARRSNPATLLDEVAALRADFQPQLTAAQLREAEDMRKQIAAERAAEAQAEIAAAEERERVAAESKAAAEVEAEAERLAGLPVHVGETVKLNADAIAQVSTAEEAVKAEAWRGVIVEIHRDDSFDDVATFEDTENPPVPVVFLEPVDLEAEARKADELAEQERLAADLAEREQAAAAADAAAKEEADAAELEQEQQKAAAEAAADEAAPAADSPKETPAAKKKPAAE